MPNNQNVALLDRLRDDLVLPCAARCQMTERQARAWWHAPMMMVSTAPLAVACYGFDDGEVVSVGALTADDVPDEAADAVAGFLSAGLRALAPDAHDDLVALINDDLAQIVILIRPDKGEVVAHLVTRGDAHKPVVLFALAAVADEVCP